MDTKTLVKVNNVAIQMVSDSTEKLIPIRPICKALGVDENTQREKLYEDEILSSVATLRVATGADGKQYEMVCIPLEFVFGWLFTINPKNVKEEAKETVTKYKLECYKALYSHFAEQSEFLSQRDKAIEQQLEVYQLAKSNFNTAKKRMYEAENQLNITRKVTFEEWRANNNQLLIDFRE